MATYISGYMYGIVNSNVINGSILNPTITGALKGINLNSLSIEGYVTNVETDIKIEGRIYTNYTKYIDDVVYGNITATYISSNCTQQTYDKNNIINTILNDININYLKEYEVYLIYHSNNFYIYDNLMKAIIYTFKHTICDEYKMNNIVLKFSYIDEYINIEYTYKNINRKWFIPNVENKVKAYNIILTLHDVKIVNNMDNNNNNDLTISDINKSIINGNKQYNSINTLKNGGNTINIQPNTLIRFVCGNKYYYMNNQYGTMLGVMENKTFPTKELTTIRNNISTNYDNYHQYIYKIDVNNMDENNKMKIIKDLYKSYRLEITKDDNIITGIYIIGFK